MDYDRLIADLSEDLEISEEDLEVRFQEFTSRVKNVRSVQHTIPKKKSAVRDPLSYRQGEIRVALSHLPEHVREHIGPEQIALRMLLNWDYDPSCPLTGEWNSECHPEYSIKGFDEKAALMWYYIKRCGVQGYPAGKNLKIVHDAVKLADQSKAHYKDWVLAQVVKTNGKCRVTHLKAKHAPFFYRSFIKDGRYIPPLVQIQLQREHLKYQ